MYLQSGFGVHRGVRQSSKKVLVSQIFFSGVCQGSRQKFTGGPLKSIHHLCVFSKDLFVDICTFYFGRQLRDEREQREQHAENSPEQARTHTDHLLNQVSVLMVIYR